MEVWEVVLSSAKKMRTRLAISALLLLLVLGGNRALAVPASISNSLPISSVPTSLSISSVGIKTALIPLGLDKDGSLSVPETGAVAGWFTGGPKPGEVGPAVIVAHVDWKGSKGVFFNLRQVRVGESILVTNSDSKITKFQVTKVSSVKKDAFPTASVYGNLDYPGLRLVTCATFDLKTKKYLDNFIVYAKAIRA